jgi:hypothetical protein
MKLAAALAVPLLALVIVTVAEVAQSSREVQRVRDQTALADASIGPTSLLSALETERNVAGVYLLDAADAISLSIDDNAEARTLVDDALSAFRSEVQARGGEIEQAYAPALEQMRSLESLRADVDAAPDASRSLENVDAASQIFDRYTEVLDAMFAANKRVALALDDPDLRRGAELIDLSSRQTNLLAILVRDVLLAAVGGSNPDGVNTSGEIAAVASHLGELRANEQLIATKASGVYRSFAEDLFAAEEIVRFPEVVDEALATSVVDIGGVLAYSAGDDPETFGYTVFGEGVSATLSAQADELEAAAEARQLWFIALAAVALVVATVVTWLVSRSITKPLRSLTRQAKDMAERRLPDAVLDILETPLGDDVSVPTVEPVAVNTRDEVGDVSAALNTVQDTALDLAVEQAVLRRNIADSFVNLGRRNQNLLGRQLDFITELETNETDPDTLANLFRLDHLATRMRRNAESLLVLAGIEPPRKWAAPVRLTDVIRAALGEVEDYQRVTVRGVEPATIIGSAAADLAHLLAELVENALVFSPPDQTVDIRGRNRPARAAAGAEHTSGYTLAVIDSGLGMPPTDVTAANRRLAGAESFTIAPSKYLGHYVAGNLAARHDIAVRLDNSPGNGITATIDIPPTLLTTDTALAAPVTPPHGTRALAPTGQTQALPVAPSGPPSPTPGWLTEPAPPAADRTVPAAPYLLPAAEVTRTQSGLVKRTSRAGNGSTVGAERPSGHLLDTLSRHAANLGGPPPAARAPVAPAPPAHAPVARPGQAPGPEPRGWAPPVEPPRPPAGRTWPAHPPTPAPPAPPEPTWSPTPAPPDWSPAPPTIPARSAPPAAPAAPLERRREPVEHPPAGDQGMTTAGGLARRVRGAQLPTTEPVRMRRSPEPSAPPAPPAPRPVRTPQQQRTADDVYSFLSNFTAGVQRGLAEGLPGQPSDDPPPR